MSIMSVTDRAYAKALLQFKVLQKIQADKLPIQSGVIVVCCGDGDQFPDRVDYLRRKVQELGYVERPHFITRHGGALRVVEDSILNNPTRTFSADLLDEIEEAMDLKKIYTIFLEAHCRCGKCYSKGLTLQAVIHELCKAKKIVAERFPNALPIKVFHIDWGNEKHYYKVSGEELERSCAQIFLAAASFEHEAQTQASTVTA